MAAVMGGGRERIRRPSIRDFPLAPLVILFVLNAVDEFDRAVLAVANDDIREHFGLSDFTVGFLPVAVVLITGLISLPAGNWADRHRRVRILSGGALIWGSAGLLAAASQSFIQLFLTRAVLGTGQGTIGPTHASLLSDYYPVGVRGRALGYHRAANPLGQVIGALIGGLIVGAIGWRWGFVAAAVPGLIFGLFALRLREPRRGEADLLDAAKQDPLLAGFLADPPDRKGFFESLGAIWRIRTLRLLIFANAAFGFALFGVVFWVPTFFERNYGLSTERASGALAFLALAAFIGTWLGGPFADRAVQAGFPRVMRIGTAGMAVLAVTWTAAFLVDASVACLGLLSLGAFLASLATPGLISTVAAISPPRIRAQSFAAFGLALAVLGASTAPVVVGLISEFLQAEFDLDSGESLRYAMLAATAAVMVLGTWLIWFATRSVTTDVNAAIGGFLAEHRARLEEQPRG